MQQRSTDPQLQQLGQNEEGIKLRKEKQQSLAEMQAKEGVTDSTAVAAAARQEVRRDGALFSPGASGRAWRGLVFLEAVFFPLVKQVCLGAAQVDDLWTAVSLQARRGRTGGQAGVSKRAPMGTARLQAQAKRGQHSSEQGGKQNGSEPIRHRSTGQ